MIIDTPVHLAIEDETPAQPIAVECEVCFAIVRKSHLDGHMHAIHARTTVGEVVAK